MPWRYWHRKLSQREQGFIVQQEPHQLLQRWPWRQLNFEDALESQHVSPRMMMEAERDHLPQMYDDFDLAIWDVDLWQCGLLSIRVGEASHPGPEEDHIEDIVGNE